MRISDWSSDVCSSDLTADHNLALLRALPRFHGLGCPLLIGVSRKSFIGAIAGEPDPTRRLPGSLAVALHAATQGAAILRVHDVPETVQALAQIGRAHV